MNKLSEREKMLRDHPVFRAGNWGRSYITNKGNTDCLRLGEHIHKVTYTYKGTFPFKVMGVKLYDNATGFMRWHFRLMSTDIDTLPQENICGDKYSRSYKAKYPLNRCFQYYLEYLKTNIFKDKGFQPVWPTAGLVD